MGRASWLPQARRHQKIEDIANTLSQKKRALHVSNKGGPNDERIRLVGAMNEM